MEQKNTPERDLESIRTLMERSVKFMSLSGISGILAGIYALSGSLAAYLLLYYPNGPTGLRSTYLSDDQLIFKLTVTASVVLIASLATGYWFSVKKAHRMGTSIWNQSSKRLLVDFSIPLVTGGLLVLIFLSHGMYGIVGPACLIFYGLSLINGSQTTVSEIRNLGLCEVALGLIAALVPGYGLILWAIGFGVMHIVYGIILYKKYDR